MGKLLSIAVRERKRSPMKLLTSAPVTLSKGVASDFRGKPGNRQVTVLSKKAWQAACDELNLTLDWLVRRSNLLVDELELQLSSGKMIKIGEVELQITRETDPCKRMEEVVPGLFNALTKEWRGGVCCRVVREGEIKVGDEVAIYEYNK